MAGDGINPYYVMHASGYPLGGSSGNVAAATATATLTPSQETSTGRLRTAFLTGFELTGTGSTVGGTIIGTVTGLAIGTKSYIVYIPASVSIQPLIVQFAQPLAASAPGTNIIVSFPSFGTGSTNACVNVHGFQI